MENEKMMDKQGMTAEREMEIMEAVAEQWGAERCLKKVESEGDLLAERAWRYRVNQNNAAATARARKMATTSLRREAAKLGVWLNILDLIVGEPVEEEIAYLEELAEEVGLDGR